jgi:hypothetical protein
MKPDPGCLPYGSRSPVMLVSYELKTVALPYVLLASHSLVQIMPLPDLDAEGTKVLWLLCGGTLCSD